MLGDNGRLYTNFDGEMIKEMRHLITKADVITPNLTELFYLLDKPYKADNTDEELKEYLRLLSDKGPQVVIISPSKLVYNRPLSPNTGSATIKLSGRRKSLIKSETI